MSIFLWHNNKKTCGLGKCDVFVEDTVCHRLYAAAYAIDPRNPLKPSRTMNLELPKCYDLCKQQKYAC